MYDFGGHVAVVTSAASSMGIAAARAFVRPAVAIALAGMNAGAVHAAADELRSEGRQFIDLRCDVANENDVAWCNEGTSHQ